MTLPVDENNNVKFPIAISGSLAVVALGTIVCDNPSFHSSQYIWPVGFKSVRQFSSMKNPDIRVSYINEILPGDQPIFRVIADDDQENAISATSPSAAWKIIIEKVNVLKKEPTQGKRMFASVSGPEYFGFSNATISKLIQELPNAEKCANYIMKKFTNGSNDKTEPASSTSSTTTTSTTEPKSTTTESTGITSSSSRVMSISNLTSPTENTTTDFPTFLQPKMEYPPKSILPPAPAQSISNTIMSQNGHDPKQIPKKFGPIDVYYTKGPSTSTIPMLHPPGLPLQSVLLPPPPTTLQIPPSFAASDISRIPLNLPPQHPLRQESPHQFVQQKDKM